MAGRRRSSPLPPVDLTALGMAGCFQYHDMLTTLLYVPAGAATATNSILVPNFLGAHIQVQSFNYDPAAGLTVLGAVASNALDLRLGDF